MNVDRRSTNNFRNARMGPLTENQAGRAEEGSGSGVKIYLGTLDVKVPGDGPASIIRNHLVDERIKKCRRLVFEFFEGQLHVAIVILIVFIISPIVPREEREKADTGIRRAVLEIVAIQHRRLGQLIQGGGFPDHQEQKHIRKRTFHGLKSTGVASPDQAIHHRFLPAYPKTD